MKEDGVELAAELLAAHPAAIGARCSIYDETPLEVACRQAYSRKLSTDLLRILLEAGHRHLFNGEVEMLPIESEVGQMLNRRDCSDETPLSELASAFYWGRGNFSDETVHEWDNYNLGEQSAGARDHLPVERMRLDWNN